MGLFTKLFLTSLVYLCLSPYGTSALSVKSIDECPPLAPRDSPATHIRDLRADDVDVCVVPPIFSPGLKHNNRSSWALAIHLCRV